jgi:hypothetical protein
VPVQDAKWLRVREAPHVADVGQNPGGAGGSDPVQVHHVRTRGTYRFGQLGLECLGAGVEPEQVGELVGGQPPHGAPHQIAGADPREHRLVCGTDFFTGIPPGTSSVISRCSRFSP